MSVTVDWRAFRGHVVRVDSQGGSILGSGFFVAPGWVLTCAHVVRDAGDVVVVPVDTNVSPVGLGAAVAARSEPPTVGALWPFPDLALLRLDEEVQHPCALLDAREPASDGDCYAWGFARREVGLDPTGSPASFRYEGLEGDDYLRLKHGQSAPGLSGAPLLCPRRRAVVGVITASRDVRSDLGGWAAPLSALLIGGPGVPSDLAELGSTLRHANRQAVVARREPWHQVLPVEDMNDLVDQPWQRFTRQAGSSPSSLLLAEHAVVPYLFREQELEAAVAWCESPAAMSMTKVAGRGGAGKTRFAVE